MAFVFENRVYGKSPFSGGFSLGAVFRVDHKVAPESGKLAKQVCVQDAPRGFLPWASSVGAAPLPPRAPTLGPARPPPTPDRWAHSLPLTGRQTPPPLLSPTALEFTVVTLIF
ncbi:hypothetical protein CapIbe_017426 [Capra ibex]